MIDTTLKIKEKLFPVFMEKVRQELIVGAKKYASDDKREWTDVIMDFDPKFMLSTMMKYIGRINNSDPRAEQDLRKITAYCFIQWVKMFGEEHLK